MSWMNEAHSTRTLRLICGLVLLSATLLLGASTTRADDGTHIAYSKFPPSAISVVAEVRAKPGKEDELRAATLPLINMVRNEPNNLVYFLHENRVSPGHFIFYEVFASEADFEAHNATRHVKAWFEKLPHLTEGSVKVTRMQILR